MKTWKLVSGIISLVICVLILFQSCAINALSAIASRDDVSASIGILFSFILMAAGIVSIVIRSSEKEGSHIALIILYVLAYLLGTNCAGSFGDLKVWALWSIACAIVATFAWSKIRAKKRADKKNKNEG